MTVTPPAALTIYNNAAHCRRDAMRQTNDLDVVSSSDFLFFTETWPTFVLVTGKCLWLMKNEKSL